MKHKLTFSSLLLLALLLTLGRAALASSIWYVDGVHGSDQNNCRTPVTACKTIGHAIDLASSGDSIFVAAATYQENPFIAKSLVLVGSGARTTIITAYKAESVVTVFTNVRVTLSNFTIQNGYNPNYVGGGISNQGTLTIQNVTVSGNTVYDGNFCSYCRVLGGGIYNTGTLTIINSTLSRNTSNAVCFGACRIAVAEGGGLYNQGTVTIINSTLSGNVARRTEGNGRGYGGGIYNLGTVAVNNSTVSANFATTSGGGIENIGTVGFQNSIIANNSGGNCDGGVTSNGYNMSSDGTCNLSNSGDRNNTDPLLGSLQYNGGPTQTMALQSGSPAIDAGNPSGCTDGNGHLLTTDQRHMPRPDHEDTGGCDMGAYESQTD